MSPSGNNHIWKDRDKVINQSIGKTFIVLAVPAVASTIFSIIFEIVDMFWVGKLGTDAVAALSAASFFVWILRGLAMTVATGTIALVSRRSGEKNETELLRTISNSIIATWLFAAIIIILFLPLTSNVFNWIKLDSNVASLAEDYSLVFLSGLFFVYTMLTLEHNIRGTGNTKIPLRIIGFSLLLNAILDPIFIFDFRLGIKGAAYATILSQAIGALLLTLALVNKIPNLKRVTLAPNPFFFKKYFYPMVKIGTPIALSEAGFSLIYLLLAGIISHFGKEPLAALGISHRIEAIPFFISLGFSMAIATIVGQNLGAAKVTKARKSVYFSLKLGVAILFLISVLFFIFAPALFSFFTKDPLVIHHGVQYLRIVAITESFLALEVILTGAFSGAGYTIIPFFIVFPLTVIRVPLAYILAYIFKLGVIAIWVIISLTTFLKGICLFFLFKKKTWSQKKI